MKHESADHHNFPKFYSTDCERKRIFYASTPIFYVNAGPHIGHLYSALLADAMTRYRAMLGEDIFLSTGTDEHGNKVETAAKTAKSPVKQYCDDVSLQFRNMCDEFNIGYNRFIRTTDEKHKEAVKHFWRKLEDRGHIYLGKYSGWYCLADEAFVPSSQLTETKDGSSETIRLSAESGHPVQWTEEENYKFRLSSFQSDLKYWLKDEKRVEPSKFHKILLNWIEEGSCMEDLSVSRPMKRAPWGIQVPSNDEHTIYVWLDALVNYLTAMGYPGEGFNEMEHWPPSLQVIGKDILKFHGIYWPAFLMAAGLEPPKKLLCHSHWTVADEKMSKSRGNVVSPFEAAQSFTNEGLRYFLLREAVPHTDGNYSEKKIICALNAELADTLGNLFNRCLGKAINPEGKMGDPRLGRDSLDSEESKELVSSLENLDEDCERSYEEFNLHHVVDRVMKSLHLANKMFEHHKPWVLKKEANAGNLDSGKSLEAVLSLGLEAARISALVLSPIVPNLSHKLLDYMGIPRHRRTWLDVKFANLPTSRQFSKDLQTQRTVLFPKLKAL